MEDKKMMLIRISSYGKHDFIDEHIKIIASGGTVWMLKTGRKIPSVKIEEILNKSKTLVLKSPKNEGGKYYIAHFTEYFQGTPTSEMNYPAYYDSLSWEYDVTPLDGTWFRIDNIDLADNVLVDNFCLCSNGKKVIDVIGQTRTSVMYVFCS